MVYSDSKISMDFSELQAHFSPYARHAGRMAFFGCRRPVHAPASSENPTREIVDQMTNKKVKVSSEGAYLAAIVLPALAVAILSAADFGISMIVAPAYLLSMKLSVLSFGQAEYVIQAGLFIVLCFVLRKFRPVYLFSFETCLIYGWILDLWRKIPFFNPSTTPPGSMALWLRIAMFVFGMALTSFSVALFFKTYLYPQVYDFFVKAVSSRYGVRLPVLKTIVDLACLTASVIMTFAFFGEIRGIGWGTLVMALLNGTVIGLFSRLLDKTFDFQLAFPRFAARFTLQAKNPAKKTPLCPAGQL